MRSKKIRRAVWIGGIVAVLLLAIPSAYLWVICSQNVQIQDAWERNAARHAATPASDSSPLERFEDASTTFVSHLGETRSPWGYRNADGEVVVEAKYASCAPEFAEGLAWATTQEGGHLYVTTAGEVALVVGIEALGVSNFSSGRARIRVRGPDDWTSDGFIDTAGKVVIAAEYRHAENFIGAYTLVQERTWISRAMESFVYRTGIGVHTCFAYRKRLLDTNGTIVQPAAIPKS